MVNLYDINSLASLLGIIMLLIYLGTKKLSNLSFSFSAITYIIGIWYTIKMGELSSNAIFLLLLFSGLFLTILGLFIASYSKKNKKKKRKLSKKIFTGLQISIGLILVIILLLFIISPFLPKHIEETIDHPITKPSIKKNKPYVDPYPNVRQMTSFNSKCVDLKGESKNDCLQSELIDHSVMIHSLNSKNPKDTMGAYSAIPVNSPKFDPECIAGGCFEFERNRQQAIKVSDDFFDFGKGAFSFCAWYKTDEYHNKGYFLFGEGTVSQPDWGFDLGDPDNPGGLRFMVRNKNANIVLDESTTMDGNWHFACGGRDESSVWIAMDGIKTKSEHSSNLVLVNNDPAYIGKSNINQYHWDGWIDEVMVFDISLTDEHITFLHELGKSGRSLKKIEPPIQKN